MNKKTIFQLLAVILIVLNTSCGNSFQKTWKYQVDNPLNTDIIIRIDEKEYTIPSLSTQEIGITQGKHTLTYNGTSVNFVTKVNSNKSITIINPTLSNYMLHANFYISEKAGDDNDMSILYDENSYEYKSDSGTVRLPVRVFNTLFIEQQQGVIWSFGLDEDAKSEINTRSTGKKLVHYKLYREAAYKAEFAGELPSGIVFPVNSTKLSEQPAYVFPTESLMSDCDAFNNFVKDLASRWDKIIANPSDIFQDVAKLSYDVVIEQGQRSKLNQQCSTRFNPGRDDKEYKEALRKLSDEVRYLSDATSFIVK